MLNVARPSTKEIQRDGILVKKRQMEIFCGAFAFTLKPKIPPFQEDCNDPGNGQKLQQNAQCLTMGRVVVLLFYWIWNILIKYSVIRSQSSHH